jgi:hypothetical protein
MTAVGAPDRTAPVDRTTAAGAPPANAQAGLLPTVVASPRGSAAASPLTVARALLSSGSGRAIAKVQGPWVNHDLHLM